MKIGNIGIDIDGVLTDIESFQLKFGESFFKKKYNKDNTFWLLEEPFTQEQIISLIFERHKIIIEPVERLSFNQEVYGV